MSCISDIVAYILATIGGRSCMSRPDTGTYRLYPENGAEFCRGNDNRRFGEMFQVAGDNFRAIFGEGGTVEHLVLWVRNWGVGFGWRYPDGVSHDKFQKCIYVCLVKGKLLSPEDLSVFFDNATGNNGCERTIDQFAKNPHRRRVLAETPKCRHQNIGEVIAKPRR